MLSCRHSVVSLCLCLISPLQLLSQDKIISLRGTEERVTEGLIIGTTPDGSPRIRTKDGVETTVRIGEVRSIIKDEPPEVVSAREAFLKGDYDKAIELAIPTAEQFSGLPVFWAVEAFGIIADSYLQKADRQNAANWYKRLSQAYGQTQFKSKGEIGLARIALLEGNTRAAEQTVLSLVEKAKSTLRPSQVESQVFADAFFVLAKIQEKNQSYAEAFASYLRIPALYPENPTLVRQATQAANLLKAEHKVYVD